jgi:hypothetical protein
MRLPSSITPPYPFHSTPIIQQLLVCFIMPSSYTNAMCFDIIHSLLFSFPLPPPASPLKSSQYYKNVYILYLCICFLWIIFHISEKICDLCLSESDLLHLNDDLQFHPFIYKLHNFILLCGWIATVYYHIFLIHSSVIRQLGCFHRLALVNSVAKKTGVQVAVLHILWIYAQE